MSDNVIYRSTRLVRLDDGREVLLSYGVPVAAFIPANYCMLHRPQGKQICGCETTSGYVKTARKYSVTTSRHANSYTGDGATVVDDATFRALIAPVTDTH